MLIDDHTTLSVINVYYSVIVNVEIVVCSIYGGGQSFMENPEIFYLCLMGLGFQKWEIFNNLF